VSNNHLREDGARAIAAGLKGCPSLVALE